VIKQGVIRVALKTLLKNKVGNLYLQNFTSASARWLCWFHIKLSAPHFTTKLRPWSKPSQRVWHCGKLHDEPYAFCGKLGFACIV